MNGKEGVWKGHGTGNEKEKNKKGEGKRKEKKIDLKLEKTRNENQFPRYMLRMLCLLSMIARISSTVKFTIS